MPRLRQSQLANFFSRLATSYSSGIDIRTILQRESELGQSSTQQIAQQLLVSAGKGSTLAAAMAESGGFPELSVAVVSAGERGGRLDQSFSRLARHYGDLVTFRNRLLAALAWPAFELTVAILMVGGLIWICDWLYTSLEIKPFDWLGMGSTTGNVIAWFVMVGLGILGLVGLAAGTRRGWFGMTPWQIARRIPLIGSTLESLALSRFSWTMSVAENAGMNSVEIIQLSLRSTESYFYQRHEKRVSEMIRKGNSFYDSLKSTTVFPDDLLIAVDNGEVAGQLAESMERVSNQYQERADQKLKLAGTVGFVLTLLFVALVVLVVAVTAVGAYTNMLHDLARP